MRCLLFGEGSGKGKMLGLVATQGGFFKIYYYGSMIFLACLLEL